MIVSDVIKLLHLNLPRTLRRRKPAQASGAIQLNGAYAVPNPY